MIQIHPASPKPTPGEIARAGDRRRQQKVAQARPAEPCGIARDQLAQLRPVTLHCHREHRRASDLQCQRLHCCEKIDTALARSFEFGDDRLGGASNVLRQERHRARRKGWRDGAALVSPIVALAEQETAAEQRTQDPHPCGSTTIVTGVLDEDMVDPLGSIENDLRPPEKATEDEVFLEGLRRERRNAILAHRAGDDAGRLRAGRRARRRRANRLCFGHRGRIRSG
jgi:hypothetical protein